MTLVVDASATLAWALNEPLATGIAEVFAQVEARGAWVPSLWWLEVANSLNVAVRRSRIDVKTRSAILADLENLRIETDMRTPQRAWGAILQFADHHALTLYDAAYLELAIRKGLPMATLDRELLAAARAANIQVINDAWRTQDA